VTRVLNKYSENTDLKYFTNNHDAYLVLYEKYRYSPSNPQLFNSTIAIVQEKRGKLNSNTTSGEKNKIITHNEKN